MLCKLHNSRSDAFLNQKRMDIFLFLHENLSCGTHKNRLREALLMNTHNVCFCAE